MSKKKVTILIIDSEPLTYKILHLVLDESNFVVVECAAGKRAIQFCASLSPDIMLIDLELPDMDGHAVIRAVREWSSMPFIIVSARSANEDVIKGLELGADDYITKPFNVDVLRARINASLRKSAVRESGESELSNGPLRINLARHEVFLGDDLIGLTKKEYNLLRYFLVNCGKILSHKDILREVWGGAHSEDVQYLRVFVGQLRNKLEKDPTRPVLITTELGVGYRMELLEAASLNNQGELRI
jgi:two-component system, OmpR family, KDP operon response regulator KdpE